MLLFIRRLFTFRNMNTHVKNYCSRCEICIKNKSRTIRPSGFMGHLGPATKPYEIMSIDTIGGFGGYGSQKRYLHLLMDHFTRHAYILTSKNQKASEMIALIDSVHKENPIGILLTDQYGAFSSQEFEDYCNAAGISHIFTAVDSAFSNGLNERGGQTLVNRIRCRYNENNQKGAWSVIAKKCIDDYNSTIHSVTGFSPKYLMYGVPENITLQTLLEVPDLIADREKAFQNSIKSHNDNKRRYDRGRNFSTFKVGEKVYVENGNRLNRGKLDEIRSGPFPIIRKLSDVVYEIDVGYKTSSKRLFHASKLVRSNGPAQKMSGEGGM